MKRGAVVLIVSCALASGCLVSFDGYQALDAGGAGQGASAGSGAAAGKNSGGSSSGGSSSGGSGDAGAASGDGGTPGGGGAPPEAGTSGTGGGSSDGGMSGSAGSSGSGGRGGTGGSAGTGGQGGTGGSAGTGGTFSTGGGGIGGGGTGGGGGSGGSPPKTCPINLPGPLMIEVPKPGGGSYCIDRTEVTNQHYAAFLASSPAANQAGTCSWNASYQPDTSLACATQNGIYDPVARPQVPVSCVDWCDAKRYCEWAGKRLCGKLGGGTNPTGSFADASSSEWYRACSKAGTLKFPYGNSYQSSYCAGLDNSGDHPGDVTSEAACVGGYAGLYDMSGNVAEWEDSCSASAGASDGCAIRGGSIVDADLVSPTLLCNSAPINGTIAQPETAPRNTRDELIGIRCCLDP